VTRPPTRQEAARALGVAATADAEACKRAYRRLAREHHPDVGGDPDRFHLLQRAYERLVADLEAPPPPLVSRGTPSRPPVSFVDETEIADLESIDWTTTLPEGRVRLDRDRLATWLAGPELGEGHRGGASADGAVMVRALTATSRAPRSRLNRAAHLLAAELTSRIRVVDTADDRGSPIVAVEVVATNRRARRALDRVPLRGGWVRTRRSSSTLLRATMPPSADARATAVRVTERLSALLDELDWPLPAWSLEQG
jgi:hypothetical protein